MIIITGAAGFIASCLAQKLLREDKDVSLLLVDNFEIEKKKKNFPDSDRCIRIDRNQLFEYLDTKNPEVSQVYHLGARTDTAELNTSLFRKLNVEYSKDMWSYCALEEIPLVYASSAATYGDGTKGFVDSHDIVSELKPLNPYGDSKQDFDKWVLEQALEPPSWYGVKFFNVFGPNEYHKGRMASVVFHAFNQIQKTGMMKLFRSHREDVKDGMQSRDFIYIEDVLDCCLFLMNEKVDSGLYNIGSGKARSFKDLVEAVFSALDKKAEIEFIDTPEDIRDTYQYFTEADMEKLKAAGYKKEFTSLESGVEKYVKEYLVNSKYY